MAIHLDRPPHSVFLAAWGRHPSGWWACVTFRARIAAAGQPELPVAAWVPAQSVRKPAWAGGAGEVPRLQLPAEQRAWTGPPGWPAWYAGVWTDGPLALPPGCTLVTGAAWRHRDGSS